MEQFELFAAPNPCIGICENSPRGYCTGCMRNREERFNWNQKSVTEKLYIMKLCRQRYQRMRNKQPALAKLEVTQTTQDTLF